MDILDPVDDRYYQPMTQSEVEILRRFQVGATGGFDDLYDQWGARVYRFCRRLTVSVADAEDLTQDARGLQWPRALRWA